MPGNAMNAGSLSAQAADQFPAAPLSERRFPTLWLYRSLVVAAFLLGLLASNLALGGRAEKAASISSSAVVTAASSSAKGGMDLPILMKQVNPPEGYTLPARYGDLGPRLLQAGAIDYAAFAAVFQNGDDPLTEAQTQILKQGSDESVVITPENAHFLLNFFWAVGLANDNPILTDGPITQYSQGKIDGFASTGGWTLGTKPVAELFASTNLITLTPEQQARVQEVASAVYRPCCDNPTIFPDCNHGMAMLGLLELLASQDTSTGEMLRAAKYVNAYWFPQQALETAMYLKAAEKVDFTDADPKVVMSKLYFSGSGAARVHAALESAGLLPQAPNNGGSCGS